MAVIAGQPAAQDGIKPVEALAQLKDRLLVVNLWDRSALGSQGRDVALGSGALMSGDWPPPGASPACQDAIVNQ